MGIHFDAFVPRWAQDQYCLPPFGLLHDKYDVVLIDPPWRYAFSRSRSRGIEQQYPTMGFEEILQLPIVELAAPNAAVFTWVTAPKLPEGLTALEAWGLNFKSSAVWNKMTMGMGYWWRGQHELLLVATTGKVKPPAPTQRVRSVIEEKRRQHSRKPDAVYEMIESAFPSARKIELFARRVRAGWDAWGNEI